MIVNYNGWDDVEYLIGSLASERAVLLGECEVVVVDNASDDPVPASFEPLPAGVRLIVRGENGGFAAGVNAGWRASRSPWLLLLNPDVAIEPGVIDRVLARIDHHEARPEGAPAVVGFALLNPDGTRQPSVGLEPGLVRSLAGQFIPRSRRKYQSGWTLRPGPVPWVTGACMLVHAELMCDLGGMDEDFFLYYEEVALCRSARDLGRRVEYDDSVGVVHLRPLQNRAISPRMRVIVRHGKLLYFRKHLPGWQAHLLAGVVAIEARVRGTIARGRGDRESVGAWDAILDLARGVPAKGTEVVRLADRATSGTPAPSRSPIAARDTRQGAGRSA